MGYRCATLFGVDSMRLISWNVNGRRGATLSRQIAALGERGPDIIALQEVRAESLPGWLDGLAGAGLPHLLDSSDQLAVAAVSGREYRWIYFNLIASRWPLRRLPQLRSSSQSATWRHRSTGTAARSSCTTCTCRQGCRGGW